MMAKILFYVFPLLLVVVPVLLHKKRGGKCIGCFKALTLSVKARKLLVNLVALIVILFHIDFYAIFPSDYGIMISTILIFVLLSAKRSEKLFQAIRDNVSFQTTIFGLTLMAAFTPHLLSLSMTMAFMLEAACLFPGRGAKDFIMEHSRDEPDYAEKFLDVYFQ